MGNKLAAANGKFPRRRHGSREDQDDHSLPTTQSFTQDVAAHDFLRKGTHNLPSSASVPVFGQSSPLLVHFPEGFELPEGFEDLGGAFAKPAPSSTEHTAGELTRTVRQAWVSGESEQEDPKKERKGASEGQVCGGLEEAVSASLIHSPATANPNQVLIHYTAQSGEGSLAHARSEVGDVKERRQGRLHHKTSSGVSAPITKKAAGSAPTAKNSASPVRPNRKSRKSPGRTPRRKRPTPPKCVQVPGDVGSTPAKRLSRSGSPCSITITPAKGAAPVALTPCSSKGSGAGASRSVSIANTPGKRSNSRSPSHISPSPWKRVSRDGSIGHTPDGKPSPSNSIRSTPCRAGEGGDTDKTRQQSVTSENRPAGQPATLGRTEQMKTPSKQESVSRLARAAREAGSPQKRSPYRLLKLPAPISTLAYRTAAAAPPFHLPSANEGEVDPMLLPNSYANYNSQGALHLTNTDIGPEDVSALMYVVSVPGEGLRPVSAVEDNSSVASSQHSSHSSHSTHSSPRRPSVRSPQRKDKENPSAKSLKSSKAASSSGGSSSGSTAATARKGDKAGSRRKDSRSHAATTRASSGARSTGKARETRTARALVPDRAGGTTGPQQTPKRKVSSSTTGPQQTPKRKVSSSNSSSAMIHSATAPQQTPKRKISSNTAHKPLRATPPTEKDKDKEKNKLSTPRSGKHNKSPLKTASQTTAVVGVAPRTASHGHGHSSHHGHGHSSNGSRAGGSHPRGAAGVRTPPAGHGVGGVSRANHVVAHVAQPATRHVTRPSLSSLLQASSPIRHKRRPKSPYPEAKLRKSPHVKKMLQRKQQQQQQQQRPSTPPLTQTHPAQPHHHSPSRTNSAPASQPQQEIAVEGKPAQLEKQVDKVLAVGSTFTRGQAQLEKEKEKSHKPEEDSAEVGPSPSPSTAGKSEVVEEVEEAETDFEGEGGVEGEKDRYVLVPSASQPLRSLRSGPSFNCSASYSSSDSTASLASVHNLAAPPLLHGSASVSRSASSLPSSTHISPSTSATRSAFPSALVPAASQTASLSPSASASSATSLLPPSTSTSSPSVSPPASFSSTSSSSSSPSPPPLSPSSSSPSSTTATSAIPSSPSPSTTPSHKSPPPPSSHSSPPSPSPKTLALSFSSASPAHSPAPTPSKKKPNRSPAPTPSKKKPNRSPFPTPSKRPARSPAPTPSKLCPPSGPGLDNVHRSPRKPNSSPRHTPRQTPRSIKKATSRFSSSHPLASPHKGKENLCQLDQSGLSKPVSRAGKKGPHKRSELTATSAKLGFLCHDKAAADRENRQHDDAGKGRPGLADRINMAHVEIEHIRRSNQLSGWALGSRGRRKPTTQGGDKEQFAGWTRDMDHLNLNYFPPNNAAGQRTSSSSHPHARASLAHLSSKDVLLRSLLHDHEDPPHPPPEAALHDQPLLPLARCSSNPLPTSPSSSTNTTQSAASSRTVSSALSVASTISPSSSFGHSLSYNTLAPLVASASAGSVGYVRSNSLCKSNSSSTLGGPAGGSSPSFSKLEPIPFTRAVLSETALTRGRIFKKHLKPERLQQRCCSNLLDNPYLQYLQEANERGHHNHLIAKDIDRTFPRNPLFHPPHTAQQSLANVLRAYSVFDPETGYSQGLAFLAGFLLLHLGDEREAFWCLVGMMWADKYNMRALYRHSSCEVLKLMLDQFHIMLGQVCPELKEHLDRLGIGPSLYATQWFCTIFSLRFDQEFAAQVWTMFLQHGPVVIFQVGLGILLALKEQMLAGGLEEIMPLLSVMARTPTQRCLPVDLLPTSRHIQLPAMAQAIVEAVVRRELEADARYPHTQARVALVSRTLHGNPGREEEFSPSSQAGGFSSSDDEEDFIVLCPVSGTVAPWGRDAGGAELRRRLEHEATTPQHIDPLQQRREPSPEPEPVQWHNDPVQDKTAISVQDKVSEHFRNAGGGHLQTRPAHADHHQQEKRKETAGAGARISLANMAARVVLYLKQIADSKLDLLLVLPLALACCCHMTRVLSEKH
eukprot:g8676.t1